MRICIEGVNEIARSERNMNALLHKNIQPGYAQHYRCWDQQVLLSHQSLPYPAAPPLAIEFDTLCLSNPRMQLEQTFQEYHEKLEQEIELF